MNTSIIPVPSSDETVQTTSSLPEIAELDSSQSTFRSDSSTSSTETGTDESASTFHESHQGNKVDRSSATTLQNSSDTTRTTSTSRRRVQGHRNRPIQRTTRRRCGTSVLVLNYLLQFSFLTIMNAAITIFGVGIGVGLILADSFRPSTNVSNNNSMNTAASTRTDDRGNENATVPVSAATPTCRATFRRAIDRIQEAPPINIAAISTMPAQ